MKEQEGDLADLLRGDSALLDAAKKGSLDRVKKLLTTENINCRDKQGRNSTPLHLAGGSSGSDCCLFMLFICRSCCCYISLLFSFILFVVAAGYNHLDVVEYLVEEGADVNAKDKGGLIPLHNASSFGVSTNASPMHTWLALCCKQTVPT